ncbi:hypothetical protein [Streptomyces sp. NPDC018610]|uniref:hypothetical protein n=1 Tax=Streptomyces sp. NPDC018610 TaxID=3365049 RepID=UPI0037AD553B
MTVGATRSYARVTEQSGVAHPVELAAIGDEKNLADTVRRHRDAGATEVVVTAGELGGPDDRLRTWEALGELARPAGHGALGCRGPPRPSPSAPSESSPRAVGALAGSHVSRTDAVCDDDGGDRRACEGGRMGR